MLNLYDDEHAWVACSFCLRLFKEDTLELELCPECYQAVISLPGRYEFVRMQQLVRLGNFQDPIMKRALNLMLEELKKLAFPS